MSEALGPAASSVGPPVPEDETIVPAADLTWRRMHPITPAIKGWKTLAGVLAIGTWQLSDNFSDSRDFLAGGGWKYVLGLVGAVAVVGFVYSAIAWRMTRFAIDDEAVHLRTGILMRQQRQARLDRLQAVDVVQPLLARLTGLSELSLEVAGGTGSAISLAYLRDADAAAVRAELLARAAGLTRADGALADEEAPEQTVIEVPTGRLIGSVLRSGVAVVVGVAVVGFIGVAVASFVFDQPWLDLAGLVYLVPAVLGPLGVFWGRFSTGFNFRAAISPDGIRLSHGLLESRAQTIAPGRVQAVRLSQPLLWRGAGWWRVEMNVAGYGGITGENESVTVLLPVGDLEQALAAVWLVLPDLGVEDPRATLVAALTGSGIDDGFTVMAPRARWLDPWAWRRNGFRVTGRALIARSGRVRRVVDLVPHERTQSLRVQQGLLQRRLRVASFIVHSTLGPVSPRIAHLDVVVAHDLLSEQVERAREARRHDSSELWMRARHER